MSNIPFQHLIWIVISLDLFDNVYRTTLVKHSYVGLETNLLLRFDIKINHIIKASLVQYFRSWKSVITTHNYIYKQTLLKFNNNTVMSIMDESS